MYLSVGVGARTGAVLIVLYAVVVPILKLVLLAVAEVFRCGESPPFKAILVGALENGFFHILGIIIPIDLFFLRGVAQPPTRILPEKIENKYQGFVSVF